MVSFFGQPLINLQLATLRQAGLNDIIVVGGYHADCLDIPGTQLVVNNRFAETNMVYSLFCAESMIDRNEDLIISYGDIVFEPKVLATLLNCNADLSIAVDRSWFNLWSERMDNPLSDAETLKLKGENKIIELGKKPETFDDIQGQYIGLIKVRSEKVDKFIHAWHSMDRNFLIEGKDFDNMYMTGFIQHLIDSGWDVRAAFIDNGWLEVDTVQDLENYEKMQAADRLKNYYNLQRID